MPRPRINPQTHRRTISLTIDPDVLLLARQQCDNLSRTIEALLVDWLDKNRFKRKS